MKPTEKLKKRYISFLVKSPEKIIENDVKTGLYSNALKFFGELGFSKIAFKLMRYEENENRGIIRCERNYKNDMLGFFALINELNGKKARVVVQKTSGMINKVKTISEDAPPKKDNVYFLVLP